MGRPEKPELARETPNRPRVGWQGFSRELLRRLTLESWSRVAPRQHGSLGKNQGPMGERQMPHRRRKRAFSAWTVARRETPIGFGLRCILPCCWPPCWPSSLCWPSCLLLAFLLAFLLVILLNILPSCLPSGRLAVLPSCHLAGHPPMCIFRPPKPNANGKSGGTFPERDASVSELQLRLGYVKTWSPLPRHAVLPVVPYSPGDAVCCMYVCTQYVCMYMYIVQAPTLEAEGLRFFCAPRASGGCTD